MKNKKIIIITVLLIMFIGATVYSIKQSYGNTLEARQRILSKQSNSVIILSEINIENSIISEIIDQQAGYGYAQFEADEKGNYSLKTKKVRTQETETIVTDIIQINDELYEIIMLNKPGLDYAEVIYTDNSTGVKQDPVRVVMDNKTVALVEAPDYFSYTRYVAIYDNAGNKFE